MGKIKHFCKKIFFTFRNLQQSQQIFFVETLKYLSVYQYGCSHFFCWRNSTRIQIFTTCFSVCFRLRTRAVTMQWQREEVRTTRCSENISFPIAKDQFRFLHVTTKINRKEKWWPDTRCLYSKFGSKSTATRYQNPIL